MGELRGWLSGRPVLGLAILMLWACVAAGCSGGSVEAGASPTAETVDSSSTTSTPDDTAPAEAEATDATADPPTTERTPPPYPEAATVNDVPGQKAFLEHWVALYNYARATGDTAPLRALGDEPLPGDAAMFNEIDEFYSKGGRIEGGERTIVHIVAYPADEEGSSNPAMTTVQAEGRALAGDGTSERIEPTGEETDGMTIWFENGRWHYYGLGTL